ncbi:MAG: tyrosine-type recombinase/integrase [Candidatus Aenigmatarchaeota archaeon]
MNPLSDYRIDVHNHKHKIELQKQILSESTMLDTNKQLIYDFFNFCKSQERIGDARLVKYLYTLRKIGEIADKPFRDVTDKDINEILTRLQEGNSVKGKPYSSHSINDFRKSISKFWRWLYYDEYQGDAPPPIKRMKTKQSNGKHEPEIYTKDEITLFLNGTINVRDKAFFSCLYDLQCRVSELLSRQMKHVRYTENGDVQILIEADKTDNSHWETLFESIGNFTTWLRLHPLPDDPNAPLWTMRTQKMIKPLSYPAVRKVFYSSCKRQSLRRLKIHTFRKSKATHDLADGVPITYIESRGSWSKGSKALQDCYLSIQQIDKENAYRKKYNMTVNNGHNEVKELKRCNRCESITETDARFCVRCGLPTDMKVVTELNNIEKKLPQLIDTEMLSELVKRVVMEEMKKNKIN